MANFCRYCGNKLTSSSKFCRFCGKPVVETSVSYGNVGGITSPSVSENNSNIPLNAQDRRTNKRKSHISIMKLLLAGLLVVQSVLVCFFVPRLIRKLWGKPSITVAHPDGIGNSDPIDIKPMDGMRITAEKNAFDKNREFKVRQATDEEISNIADKIGDHGIIVAAIDIDAGLSSDDYIPGTYEVEFDMKTLGIPESLKDQVMVARMDANGELFPYVTECDGDIIRYSSKQNSVSAIFVGTFAIGTLTYVVRSTETHDYRYYDGKTLTGIGNGRFNLEWAVEDFAYFGEDSTESVKLDHALSMRSLELYDEALQAIPIEMYRTSSNGQVYLTAQADAARRKDVLETWKNQCEIDTEYQRLKNKLWESYPQVIKELYKCADEAWNYLAGPEQNAKMPSYQVEILLKRKVDGAEADTHKVLYKNITVNLAFEEKLYPKTGRTGTTSNGSNDALESPEQKNYEIPYHIDMPEPQEYDRLGMEDIMLTMVHELFHVSQYMYYSSAYFAAYTSNMRLFEAQANVVEAQAFTSFMNKRMLPECAKNGYTVEEETLGGNNHVLTLWNQWEYMAVPLDKTPKIKSNVNDSGYNEANYLKYMCKNYGDITMGKMMESFSMMQSFSGTVQLAWGITPEEQQSSYDKFLQELRNGDLPPSKMRDSEYGDIITVTKRTGLLYSRNNMVYNDAENLCYNKITFGIPLDAEYSLVTAGLDTGHSGIAEKGKGLYEIRFAFDKPPIVQPKEIDQKHNIFFLPVQKQKSKDNKVEIWITELLRKPNGNTPGFEICAMLAPEKPRVEIDGKKLQVMIPKMKQDKLFSMKSLSSVAEEMGIQLTLEREDGKIFQERFPSSKAGKTVELDLETYMKGWEANNNPGFRCCIQEYFMIDGSIYAGPRSGMFSVGIEGEDKPGTGVYEMYVDYELHLPPKDGIKNGPERPFNNKVEVYDDDTFRVEIPAFTYTWTSSSGKKMTYKRETSLMLKGEVVERHVSEGMTEILGYITEGVPNYFTEWSYPGYVKGGWSYPDGVQTEREEFTTGKQGVVLGHNKDTGDHGYSFILQIYKTGRVWLSTSINMDQWKHVTLCDGEVRESDSWTYFVSGDHSMSINFRIDPLEKSQ